MILGYKSRIISPFPVTFQVTFFHLFSMRNPPVKSLGKKLQLFQKKLQLFLEKAAPFPVTYCRQTFSSPSATIANKKRTYHFPKRQLQFNFKSFGTNNKIRNGYESLFLSPCCFAKWPIAILAHLSKH